MFDQVLEFHEKFGHPIGVPFSIDHLELRGKLILEEEGEVLSELWPEILEYDEDSTIENSRIDITNIDKVKLTKELCDLLYVVLGTGVTFGLPLKEAFTEVHRSNMSKLGTDGKPVLREDGKVLKGPNYSPANLEQFF